MREIEGDFVQNPDGTWKKTKSEPSFISRFIKWLKEVFELIKD